MNLVPLSQLCAGLANPPHRNDEDGLNAYRALCGKIYFAALQAGTSGAFPPKTMDDFPSVKSKAPRNAPTLAKAFDLMGLSQLRLWAKQFSTWLSDLPEKHRERIKSTEVLP